MKLLKRTWAEVSLDNLTHNYEVIRTSIPSGCRFLGVVKGDAYGHGAVPVSLHLEDLGAEFLAVSNLEEAVQLRRGGIRLPILILGYTPPVHAPYMCELGIRQEVHSLEYARALNYELAASKSRLKIHLKLDTGMGRLGFPAGNSSTLDQLCSVMGLSHLETEGLFTHFPAADSLEPQDVSFTRQQYSLLYSYIEALNAKHMRPEICHCCNSGATILYPEYALDMVRPGVATYGIPPSPQLEGRMNLRLMFSLSSTVSQIHHYPAGVSIGYGRTYVTPSPKTIAVVTIGYADGLPRFLSGRTHFLLHGKKVPVVGRICMDMCMVDITDVPNAKVGDPILVMGSGTDGSRSVNDIAKQMETIPYEILCSINKRIPRIYITDHKISEVLQYIV